MAQVASKRTMEVGYEYLPYSVGPQTGLPMPIRLQGELT